MNRAERRRSSREIGKEGLWKRELSPKQLGQGTGWFGEMDKVFSNGKYVVMSRNVNTLWGVVEHVCMRNATSTDIPWREKQRIKNELFGKEKVAVEVFPKESELVDEANMYHIWILPDKTILPFGLRWKE